MAKAWLIPMTVIVESERRAGTSFVARAAAKAVRGTTVTLWSKNTMRCYRFRNARRCSDRFAYIAERNAVPGYFSEVITEVPHASR